MKTQNNLLFHVSAIILKKDSWRHIEHWLGYPRVVPINPFRWGDIYSCRGDGQIITFANISEHI